MRARRAYAVALAFMALIGAGVILASNHTAGDYAYRLPVCVTNTTGSTITNQAAAFTINAAALESGGFVRPDFPDLFPANDATAPVPMLAQDITASDSRWWITMGSLGAGQERCWYVYMGNATAQRDQAIWLHGASESVDVDDHESLRMTETLVMESLATTFRTIPNEDTYLIIKPGSYALGVRDGGVLFAWIDDGDAGPYEVSTTIDTDTLYYIQVWYDGADLRMFVNTVLVADEPVAVTIATNTADVVIADGVFVGSIGRSRVGYLE